MLIKKIFLYLLPLAVIALILNTSIRSQEIPNGNDNKPVVDSIDIQENLLDSNEAYKQQFDSLSKDGEWIEMNKSDFVRDLNYDTGEDLDSFYPSTTEVIYVWRPYGMDPFWNPYTNGMWAFTNLGWIWSSYYNWGWGPYNYGRWYYSGLYGWTWLPGNVWACNWVTWRQYNNYVGWYPTCPRIYWRGAGNVVYSNRLFTYVPANWVFVDKKDFTKKIDNTTRVSSVNNAKILKGSEKMKTAVYVDPNMPKIKYSGPDVKAISKAAGEKITPKKAVVNDPNGKQLADQKNVTPTRNNSVKPVKEENAPNTKPGSTNYKKSTKSDKKNKTKPSVNSPPPDSGTNAPQKGDGDTKQGKAPKSNTPKGNSDTGNTKKSNDTGNRK